MSNPGSRSTHKSAISASSASLSDVQSLVPTSNGIPNSVLVSDPAPGTSSGDDSALVMTPGCPYRIRDAHGGSPTGSPTSAFRAWHQVRTGKTRGKEAAPGASAD